MSAGVEKPGHSGNSRNSSRPAVTLRLNFDYGARRDTTANLREMGERGGTSKCNKRIRALNMQTLLGIRQEGNNGKRWEHVLESGFTKKTVAPFNINSIALIVSFLEQRRRGMFLSGQTRCLARSSQLRAYEPTDGFALAWNALTSSRRRREGA